MKMRLIDPAAGEAARHATAMLKAKDLVTMSKRARDLIGDLEEVPALLRSGIRKIAKRPSRHN